MNIDLAGPAAVVTGAGRGIGLAVTRALAASGARVIAGALHSSADLDLVATAGTVTVYRVGPAAPGGRPSWSPRQALSLVGHRGRIFWP